MNVVFDMSQLQCKKNKECIPENVVKLIINYVISVGKSLIICVDECDTRNYLERMEGEVFDKDVKCFRRCLEREGYEELISDVNELVSEGVVDLVEIALKILDKFKFKDI